MRIKVIKNEYDFIPDIGNNLELAKEDQFKVILKKVNHTLDSNYYIDYNLEAVKELTKDEQSVKEEELVKEFKTNKYYEAHIVKFVNPIIIEDEKGKTKELSKEDLFSGVYSSPKGDEDNAFDDLINQIVVKITDLTTKKEEDEKKF